MSEWDIVLRLFILQSILTSQYHVSHSGALLQILWKNKESQEYKKKKDKESKMEEAENNKAILFQSDKSTIGKKRFLRAYCKESSNSDLLLEHFSHSFQ